MKEKKNEWGQIKSKKLVAWFWLSTGDGKDHYTLWSSAYSAGA